MPSPLKTDAERTDRFARYAGMVDIVDLEMVGDRTVDAILAQGVVASVKVTPAPNTVTICGYDLTMQASSVFQFKDGSLHNVPLIIKGNDDDDIFGFRGVTIPIIAHA